MNRLSSSRAGIYEREWRFDWICTSYDKAIGFSTEIFVACRGVGGYGEGDDGDDSSCL